MRWDEYSEEVLEHFKHPKNMGVIENPDGVGHVGNPMCGDIMEIYIKVKDKIITDIKFKTFGCVAAIATSSMLTELVKGKTLEEAEKISNQQIAKSLGGLPPVKMHCSVLAADALKKAIKDYYQKMKIEPDKIVDAYGRVCPVPLNMCSDALEKMEKGQIVKVIADDEGVKKDFPEWCKKTGNKLLKIEKKEDIYHIFIQKSEKIG
jgi:nitrogen fixation NifU-like protein